MGADTNSTATGTADVTRTASRAGATITAVETRFVRLPLAFSYRGSRAPPGGGRWAPAPGSTPGR